LVNWQLGELVAGNSTYQFTSHQLTNLPCESST
jgi:hypothetical protein